MPRTPGWPNLPFAGFANNAAWVELVLMAQDLLAFTQGLVLGGELATAEPRRLRYMILHMAGRITRGSRQVTLHPQHNWRWAAELANAFARLRALPLLS